MHGYADQTLRKYVSQRVYDSGIVQLINHKSGILCLGANDLTLISRRGVVQWHFEHADLYNSTCMAYTSNVQNELLIGGTGGQLIKVDLTTQSISAKIPYLQSLLYMTTNSAKYICLGRADGSIDIMGSKTPHPVVTSFPGHDGSLSCLDSAGNLLLSCTFSVKGNSYVIDPMVNVYDLDSLRPLPPVPFPAGAVYARFHSKLPGVVVATSQTGLLQFIDIFNQANLQVYEAEVSQLVTGITLSPSGDFMVLTEGMKDIRLWCNSEALSMAVLSAPLDEPDVDKLIMSYVGIDDLSFPLSTVGMPYYTDTLLSAWPKDTKFKCGQMPQKIDPELLRNTRKIQGLFCASYDRAKYGPRNLATSYASTQDKLNKNKMTVPKFLSEKNADEKAVTEEELKEGIENKEIDIFDYRANSTHYVPNCFTKLEILYSKFGVEDFDFDFYNKSRYAGLESHVENSYTNSLLQLYRFAPAFYNFVVLKLLDENLREDSILTGLGYLYDMLSSANGKHCRSSNFQRVLTNIKQFKERGLWQHDGFTKNQLTTRKTIQDFNVFCLEYIDNECKQRNSENGLFTCVYDVLSSSLACPFQKKFQMEEVTINVLPLNQPSTPILLNKRAGFNVLNFIEAVFNAQFQQQSFCDYCNQTHSFSCVRRIAKLPPLITVNLRLSNKEFEDISKFKDWLLPEFLALQSQHSSKITLGTKQTDTTNVLDKYELLGYVCEITSKERVNHLVTFIKIPNAGWFLFNDFLVMKIPEKEVFNLSYWWKTPVILLYRNEKSDAENVVLSQYRDRLNTSVLYKDHFAEGLRESTKTEYEKLTQQEAPVPGTLFAIDAEFVSLEPEEVELSSSGCRKLVRPKRQSLARVSVIRGERGEKHGVPIIDDYIVTKENISDYLTKYSGIKPGDLSPETSDKSLVPLCVAYRRLWLLLQLGCVFIGHGLINDFRTINIHVPKSQVRDTAELYYLPKEKRRLSLKFLSYIVLGQDVQTGDHDSIEDARSALHLYDKYLEFSAAGEFENALERIYIEGQYLRFKPGAK